MNANPMLRAGKIGAMVLALFAFCLALAGDVPFNGSSSGTFSIDAPSAEVNSLGHATILGPFRSHEELTLDAFGGVTGEIDWMAADGSTMTAAVNGAFTSETSVSGTYTVTGGTGRFVGAAGSASFTANITGAGTLSTSFTGSLSSH